MSELSISNVIRVTVQGVQRGISVKNINQVALFTPEATNSLDPYMICYDASQVIQAYGTDSLTAKMAQNLFAQTPNVISGGGYLVVVPMRNAVSAKGALFTTEAISNIEGFKSVTDGSLKITADGTVYDLSGMNFANCNNISDIATVIANNVTGVSVTASGTSIIFGSKKVGANSTVVLSSGTGGTDISQADYLNVASGETTAGADSSGESLEEAIERIKSQVAFTGVMTALYMEDGAVESASDYISSQDMIFVNAWYSATDITGMCTQIQQASQQQTRCLVYTNSFEDAKLMMAAYVGRAFSVNFSGSQTSQTMNLKSLTNVVPDTGIDQTDYTNAEEAGVDLYVSYEGDPAVKSNGGNGYFDTVYENMALKFHVQTGMYNVLKTTGTKVPQTETGMAALTNGMAQVFIQFVRNGVIAPGTWNSSQTFGDPETFKQNIANQGWYIYHTPIAEQAQSEREQRIAPMIQGAVKRAGAIHEADVLIIVEE